MTRIRRRETKENGNDPFSTQLFNFFDDLKKKIDYVWTFKLKKKLWNQRTENKKMRDNQQNGYIKIHFTIGPFCLFYFFLSNIRTNRSFYRSFASSLKRSLDLNAWKRKPSVSMFSVTSHVPPPQSRRRTFTGDDKLSN